MSSVTRTRYRVTDQLFLWLLTDPAQPVAIGELSAWARFAAPDGTASGR